MDTKRVVYVTGDDARLRLPLLLELRRRGFEVVNNRKLLRLNNLAEMSRRNSQPATHHSFEVAPPLLRGGWGGSPLLRATVTCAIASTCPCSVYPLRLTSSTVPGSTPPAG